MLLSTNPPRKMYPKRESDIYYGSSNCPKPSKTIFLLDKTDRNSFPANPLKTVFVLCLASMFCVRAFYFSKN